jgi:hypothetical protein
MIPSFRSVYYRNTSRHALKYVTPFTRNFKSSTSGRYSQHYDPESIGTADQQSREQDSSQDSLEEDLVNRSDEQDPRGTETVNHRSNEETVEAVNPQWSKQQKEQHTPSPKNNDALEALFSKPSWSVRSLLLDPDTPLSNEVTPQKLHHLLRLSALPQPKNDLEEKEMLKELHSHLHFVQNIQSVDTEGVDPLQSIRDETTQGVKEATIGFHELRYQLGQEEVKGRGKHPRRPRIKPEIRKGVEDWDVLGSAQDKVDTPAGSYFVVRSGQAGELHKSYKPIWTYKAMGQSVPTATKIKDLPPDTPLYKVYSVLSDMLPELPKPEDMTTEDLFSALMEWEALSEVKRSQNGSHKALYAALEESISEVTKTEDMQNKPALKDSKALYKATDALLYEKD